MVEITAVLGLRCKNDRSNSSASTKKTSPWPTKPPSLPISCPPINPVIGWLFARKICAIIEVIVVFPWLPATAIVVRFLVSNPRHSERLSTVNDFLWKASIKMGLALLMAGVYTTKSTLLSREVSSLNDIWAPLLSRWLVMGDSVRS